MNVKQAVYVGLGPQRIRLDLVCGHTLLVPGVVQGRLVVMPRQRKCPVCATAGQQSTRRSRGSTAAMSANPGAR